MFDKAAVKVIETTEILSNGSNFFPSVHIDEKVIVDNSACKKKNRIMHFSSLPTIFWSKLFEFGGQRL